MRHGSLFSGIGGFDLAAEWMGWENVFQCEMDSFCRRVLGYYWPNAVCYEDVRKFDATVYRGSIDVLSGGFPCQPFSAAGRRKGTADDRYLWPEMYRIIREVWPCWVVGENVPGLLAWSKGLVFEQVLLDLEAAGYEAWAVILPAAGVGAPHRRDRIWFVAHAGSEPGGRREGAWVASVDQGEGAERGEKANFLDGLCAAGFTADADGGECKTGVGIQDESGKPAVADGGKANVSDADGGGRSKGWGDKDESENAGQNAGEFDTWDAGDAWENFPTQPPICTGDDGFPGGLDGISFSRWRKESIKGAGNAIVPQVAWRIFKVIDKCEREARRL
jgi:DNA (cytosine-5)-methyltransferase 1